MDEKMNTNAEFIDELDLDLSATEFEEDQLEEDQFEVKSLQDKLHHESMDTKAIELSLTAVSGQVSLSLDELLGLRVGDAFPIGEFPARVKLFLNGVLIGSGYLVEFNGRVGVKIANIYSKQYDTTA